MGNVLKKSDFISDFRELEVYKIAYEVSISIHKATLNFPKHEQFSLTSQIRRASKSICANIAEGYGKQSYSKLEFGRFISIAIGSSNEMLVWMDYCKDLKYIDEILYKEWNKKYDLVIRMLHKLRQKINL